jgi:hypothetical protein
MRWFAFKDLGRSFELLVVIGTDVSDTLSAETWSIVNSLAFEPRLPLDAPPGLDAVFAGNVFVIDSGSGPVVCAGGVAASLPPQCGGPALDGLVWDAVPWAETTQGQTWAGIYIEVRLEQGYLVLESAPQETRPAEGNRVDFTPPCPIPDSGWAFSPGPGSDDDALNAAMDYIQGQADHSAAWVYDLAEIRAEFAPTELVLVAAFAGDLGVHEAAIRET